MLVNKKNEYVYNQLCIVKTYNVCKIIRLIILNLRVNINLLVIITKKCHTFFHLKMAGYFIRKVCN